MEVFENKDISQKPENTNIIEEQNTIENQDISQLQQDPKSKKNKQPEKVETKPSPYEQIGTTIKKIGSVFNYYSLDDKDIKNIVEVYRKGLDPNDPNYDEKLQSIKRSLELDNTGFTTKFIGKLGNHTFDYKKPEEVEKEFEEVLKTFKEYKTDPSLYKDVNSIKSYGDEYKLRKGIYNGEHEKDKKLENSILINDKEQAATFKNVRASVERNNKNIDKTFNDLSKAMKDAENVLDVKSSSYFDLNNKYNSITEKINKIKENNNKILELLSDNDLSSNKQKINQYNDIVNENNILYKDLNKDLDDFYKNYNNNVVKQQTLKNKKAVKKYIDDTNRTLNTLKTELLKSQPSDQNKKNKIDEIVSKINKLQSKTSTTNIDILPDEEVYKYAKDVENEVNNIYKDLEDSKIQYFNLKGYEDVFKSISEYDALVDFLSYRDLLFTRLDLRYNNPMFSLLSALSQDVADKDKNLKAKIDRIIKEGSGTVSKLLTFKYGKEGSITEGEAKQTELRSVSTYADEKPQEDIRSATFSKLGKTLDQIEKFLNDKIRERIIDKKLVDVYNLQGKKLTDPMKVISVVDAELMKRMSSDYLSKLSSLAENIDKEKNQSKKEELIREYNKTQLDFISFLNSKFEVKVQQPGAKKDSSLYTVKIENVYDYLKAKREVSNLVYSLLADNSYFGGVDKVKNDLETFSKTVNASADVFREYLNKNGKLIRASVYVSDRILENLTNMYNTYYNNYGKDNINNILLNELKVQFTDLAGKKIFIGNPDKSKTIYLFEEIINTDEAKLEILGSFAKKLTFYNPNDLSTDKIKELFKDSVFDYIRKTTNTGSIDVLKKTIKDIKAKDYFSPVLGVLGSIPNTLKNVFIDAIPALLFDDEFTLASPYGDKFTASMLNGFLFSSDKASKYFQRVMMLSSLERVQPEMFEEEPYIYNSYHSFVEATSNLLGFMAPTIVEFSITKRLSTRLFDIIGKAANLRKINPIVNTIDRVKKYEQINKSMINRIPLVSSVRTFRYLKEVKKGLKPFDPSYASELLSGDLFAAFSILNEAYVEAKHVELEQEENINKWIKNNSFIERMSEQEIEALGLGTFRDRYNFIKNNKTELIANARNLSLFGNSLIILASNILFERLALKLVNKGSGGLLPFKFDKVTNKFTVRRPTIFNSGPLSSRNLIDNLTTSLGESFTELGQDLVNEYSKVYDVYDIDNNLLSYSRLNKALYNIDFRSEAEMFASVFLSSFLIGGARGLHQHFAVSKFYKNNKSIIDEFEKIQRKFISVGKDGKIDSIKVSFNPLSDKVFDVLINPDFINIAFTNVDKMTGFKELYRYIDFLASFGLIGHVSKNFKMSLQEFEDKFRTVGDGTADVETYEKFLTFLHENGYIDGYDKGMVLNNLDEHKKSLSNIYNFVYKNGEDIIALFDDYTNIQNIIRERVYRTLKDKYQIEGKTDYEQILDKIFNNLGNIDTKDKVNQLKGIQNKIKLISTIEYLGDIYNSIYDSLYDEKGETKFESIGITEEGYIVFKNNKDGKTYIVLGKDIKEADPKDVKVIQNIDVSDKEKIIATISKIVEQEYEKNFLDEAIQKQLLFNLLLGKSNEDFVRLSEKIKKGQYSSFIENNKELFKKISGLPDEEIQKVITEGIINDKDIEFLKEIEVKKDIDYLASYLTPNEFQNSYNNSVLESVKRVLNSYTLGDQNISFLDLLSEPDKLEILLNRKALEKTIKEISDIVKEVSAINTEVESVKELKKIRKRVLTAINSKIKELKETKPEKYEETIQLLSTKAEQLENTLNKISSTIQLIKDRTELNDTFIKSITDNFGLDDFSVVKAKSIISSSLSLLFDVFNSDSGEETTFSQFEEKIKKHLEEEIKKTGEDEKVAKEKSDYLYLLLKKEIDFHSLYVDYNKALSLFYISDDKRITELVKQEMIKLLHGLLTFNMLFYIKSNNQKIDLVYTDKEVQTEKHISQIVSEAAYNIAYNISDKIMNALTDDKIKQNIRRLVKGELKDPSEGIALINDIKKQLFLADEQFSEEYNTEHYELAFGLFTFADILYSFKEFEGNEIKTRDINTLLEIRKPFSLRSKIKYVGRDVGNMIFYNLANTTGIYNFIFSNSFGELLDELGLDLKAKKVDKKGNISYVAVKDDIRENLFEIFAVFGSYTSHVLVSKMLKEKKLDYTYSYKNKEEKRETAILVGDIVNRLSEDIKEKLEEDYKLFDEALTYEELEQEEIRKEEERKRKIEEERKRKEGEERKRKERILKVRKITQDFIHKIGTFGHLIYDGKIHKENLRNLYTHYVFQYFPDNAKEMFDYMNEVIDELLSNKTFKKTALSYRYDVTKKAESVFIRKEGEKVKIASISPDKINTTKKNYTVFGDDTLSRKNIIFNVVLGKNPDKKHISFIEAINNVFGISINKSTTDNFTFELLFYSGNNYIMVDDTKSIDSLSKERYASAGEGSGVFYGELDKSIHEAVVILDKYIGDTKLREIINDNKVIIVSKEVYDSYYDILRKESKDKEVIVATDSNGNFTNEFKNFVDKYLYYIDVDDLLTDPMFIVEKMEIEKVKSNIKSKEKKEKGYKEAAQFLITTLYVDLVKFINTNLTKEEISERNKNAINVVHSILPAKIKNILKYIFDDNLDIIRYFILQSYYDYINYVKDEFKDFTLVDYITDILTLTNRQIKDKYFEYFMSSIKKLLLEDDVIMKVVDIVKDKEFVKKIVDLEEVSPLYVLLTNKLIKLLKAYRELEGITDKEVNRLMERIYEEVKKNLLDKDDFTFEKFNTYIDKIIEYNVKIYFDTKNIDIIEERTEIRSEDRMLPEPEKEYKKTERITIVEDATEEEVKNIQEQLDKSESPVTTEEDADNLSISKTKKTKGKKQLTKETAEKVINTKKRLKEIDNEINKVLTELQSIGIYEGNEEVINAKIKDLNRLNREKEQLLLSLTKSGKTIRKKLEQKLKNLYPVIDVEYVDDLDTYIKNVFKVAEKEDVDPLILFQIDNNLKGNLISAVVTKLGKDKSEEEIKEIKNKITNDLPKLYDNIIEPIINELTEGYKDEKKKKAISKKISHIVTWWFANGSIRIDENFKTEDYDLIRDAVKKMLDTGTQLDYERHKSFTDILEDVKAKKALDKVSKFPYMKVIKQEKIDDYTFTFVQLDINSEYLTVDNIIISKYGKEYYDTLMDYYYTELTKKDETNNKYVITNKQFSELLGIEEVSDEERAKFTKEDIVNRLNKLVIRAYAYRQFIDEAVGETFNNWCITYFGDVEFKKGDKEIKFKGVSINNLYNYYRYNKYTEVVNIFKDDKMIGAQYTNETGYGFFNLKNTESKYFYNSEKIKELYTIKDKYVVYKKEYKEYFYDLSENKISEIKDIKRDLDNTEAKLDRYIGRQHIIKNKKSGNEYRINSLSVHINNEKRFNYTFLSFYMVDKSKTIYFFEPVNLESSYKIENLYEEKDYLKVEKYNTKISEEDTLSVAHFKYYDSKDKDILKEPKTFIKVDDFIKIIEIQENLREEDVVKYGKKTLFINKPLDSFYSVKGEFMDFMDKYSAFMVKKTREIIKFSIKREDFVTFGHKYENWYGVGIRVGLTNVYKNSVLSEKEIELYDEEIDNFLENATAIYPDYINPDYFYYDEQEQAYVLDDKKLEEDLKAFIQKKKNENIEFQKQDGRIVGAAHLNAAKIFIDKVYSKDDTLPHEYAHFYIRWFYDTPIVQEAIRQFGSEEALVQAIGEQAVKQQGEAWTWWKKFSRVILEFIRNLISIKKIDKDTLLSVLTDMFLQRIDLVTGEEIDFEKIMKKKETKKDEEEIDTVKPKYYFNLSKGKKNQLKYEISGDKEVYEDIDLEFKIEPVVNKMLIELNNTGSNTIIVGGAVRDKLLGKTPKDLDIEVYNKTADELQEFLEQYGEVDLVGKSFGVLKFRPIDKLAKILEENELPDNGLIVNIGISGSGKSTFSNEMIKKYSDKVVVVSTDDLRVEILGDINDQSRNAEIFRIAEDRIIKHLREGKIVIYDATNLNTLYRNKGIARIYNTLKKENININIHYKIFQANVKLSYERITKQLSRGENRANIPLEILEKQYRDYQQTLKDIEMSKSMEEDYDFTLPRVEKKVGQGHKGFDIQVVKDLDVKEASKRRDFTWNSMGYNPITKTLYDYFGGINHLRDGVIRHVDDRTFAEDPLRILRAMQFSARMGMSIHEDTIQLMKKLVETGEFDTVSPARFLAEFTKWAEKGKYHGGIFEFLRVTGLGDKYFPDLMKLKSTPQDPEWHPEGDVEEHTIQVLAKANEIAEREGLNAEDKAVLIFAALFHDIAKPQTTQEVFDEKRNRIKITARGHEEMGSKLFVNTAKKMGLSNEMIDKLTPIIREHLAHASISAIKEEAGRWSAFKKLMNRLDKRDIEKQMYLGKMLLLLMEADMMGRNNSDKEVPETIEMFKRYLDKYAEENKNNKYVERYITGKDLIDTGIQNKRLYGIILSYMEDLQLSGKFNNRSEALEYLNENLSSILDKANQEFLSDPRNKVKVMKDGLEKDKSKKSNVKTDKKNKSEEAREELEKELKEKFYTSENNKIENLKKSEAEKITVSEETKDTIEKIETPVSEKTTEQIPKPTEEQKVEGDKEKDIQSETEINLEGFNFDDIPDDSINFDNIC